MNVIGHAGLTIGAFFILEQAITSWTRLREATAAEAAADSQASADATAPPPDRRPLLSGGAYLALAVGSLLPDIVDKPLGFWLAPELVNYSLRSVGHSLLFNMFVLGVALAVAVRLRTATPLFFAVASLGHLVLDRIWLNPTTMLWPLLGAEFRDSGQTFARWVYRHLLDLRHSPGEMIGGAFLVVFTLSLLTAKFRGKVDDRVPLVTKQVDTPDSQTGPRESRR